MGRILAVTKVGALHLLVDHDPHTRVATSVSLAAATSIARTSGELRRAFPRLLALYAVGAC
jgi:hypothetical protein